MSKKKVLITANLIGFVGFLWNNIEVLQKMGYEIHFAADAETISGENHEKELEEHNVIFHQVCFASKSPFSKENMNAFKTMKHILKSHEFDLIHCHTPIAGFITRFAAIGQRRRGTKVIYTSHGFAFTHISPKRDWIIYYTIEKLASLLSDAIITINHEDYNNAKKMWCKNVYHINGVGVDTSFYHNVDINIDEYKKVNGIPTDKIMVLSVGELSARKNHQIIIRALSRLPDKDSYVFVICGREVGGTCFAEMLKKQAENYGVNIMLLGHRSDIPELMHCSDIGAIPSVREGLGLAGVQSLCAGVPLVGSRVQGICDYIFDNITGYLCEPYDEEGYAKAIKKLSDKNTREKMKKNCYDIAKRFDVEVSNAQMAEIYKSVSNNGGIYE